MLYYIIYLIISYHIISYHIISYIISYHIISYYMLNALEYFHTTNALKGRIRKVSRGEDGWRHAEVKQWMSS